MPRIRKKPLLPKPRPPTAKELHDMRLRQEEAIDNMLFYDGFSPALRSACNKYPCMSWQVDALLARGYSDEQIIAALKKENGES